MAPAKTPSRPISAAAGQSPDIDVAIKSDIPAPNTETINSLTWLIRCRDKAIKATPIATPIPSAVWRTDIPSAGFSPRTSLAKIGPNGISMPPPIRPAPKAAHTALTTGFTNMNSHPSRNSSIVDFRSSFGFFLSSITSFDVLSGIVMK